MNSLYKCEGCVYAATSQEALVAHILNEHTKVPEANRIVAFPDDEGGYWIGRTYDV